MSIALQPKLEKSERDTKNWKWQLQNSVKDLSGVHQYFTPTDSETTAILGLQEKYVFGV